MRWKSGRVEAVIGLGTPLAHAWLRGDDGTPYAVLLEGMWLEEGWRVRLPLRKAEEWRYPVAVEVERLEE
jgi:hypothetical protein